MVADVEREAMIVIADFAGSPVVVAAEAAKVNLLGIAIAAAVAAAIFAIAVTEAVVLKLLVTIVVIVAAAVSSETDSAGKTVVDFVVYVLAAAAAAAFVRGPVEAPFVAETASPLVVMSTDLNSC